MDQKTTVISENELRAQQENCQRIREYWGAQGLTPLAFVDTYGCQQNEADSERIRGMLEEAGYGLTGEAEGADVVVFNTCAVREHAEQRVFGNVGALVHTKRRHPRQKIFVCGCMMGQPEVARKMRCSYSHVDGLFSTHHLWEFPGLLLQVLTTGKRVFATGDAAGSIAEGLPVSRESGLKAWVSIMYGCNNFCSYCIVPYVRGRERSRRPEDVVAECRALVENGYKDITLLGQNVNSYGKDLGLGVDFSDLLLQIAAIPGDYLLRFMTSHPKDATPKLFGAMAQSPRIARQLHLPFQSGNDRVLAAMNRHYDRAQYLELVRQAREAMPDLVLTSDVIVGFPGETEAEFEDTLSLIEAVGYDALFTFLYSPRPGTPAAKLPDPVPRHEKSAWFDRLCETQNRISAERHHAYVGKTMRVLVDGRDGALLTARTDGGRLVRLEGPDALIGQFIPVRITGCATWSLCGEQS
ncbi:MAG: tRNA (N6-isopentenyl adenosine(37)-C2)-methylthiotransferase MiaB [Oscillospiraceae bacterium]|nr:tRNA (N6-isopentenyl adenosine(37)-C2)-methylthiotransferase MiaB [Oscillospiraceae bacterium]